MSTNDRELLEMAAKTESDPVVWTGPSVRQTVMKHASGSISVRYDEPLLMASGGPAKSRPRSQTSRNVREGRYGGRIKGQNVRGWMGLTLRHARAWRKI